MILIHSALPPYVIKKKKRLRLLAISNFFHGSTAALVGWSVGSGPLRAPRAAPHGASAGCGLRVAGSAAQRLGAPAPGRLRSSPSAPGTVLGVKGQVEKGRNSQPQGLQGPSGCLGTGSQAVGE